MKILICVEFYSPSRGGVQYHNELIVNNLIQNNFDVQVATSYDKNRDLKEFNYPIHEFNCYGNIATGLGGEDVEKFQKFLIKSKFDYIFFYAAQQWSLDLALPIIHLIKGKKIFIPCGFSKLKNIFYYLYFFILRQKLSYFSKIIFFSKITPDYKYISKFNNKNLLIIPNAGEDFKKILVKKNKKDYLRILNVANFNFLKNQISIILSSLFFKKKFKIYFIYSKKNFYFYFCNILSKIIEFFCKNKKYLFFYDINKLKIKKFYKGSDLFIFTSLVECSPLVIHDCITSGLKFVTSNVGNCSELVKQDKSSYIYKNLFNLISIVNNFKSSYEKKNKNLTWNKIIPNYAKFIQSHK